MSWINAGIAVVGVVSGIAGQNKQMKGQKANARAEAEARRKEAAMQRERAIEVEAVGQFNAGIVRREGRRLIGAQRTVMAASGLRSDDSGGQFIQDKTVEALTIEELLIRHNSETEARTLRQEADALESGANMTLAAARRGNTASALSFASSWATMYGSSSFGAKKKTTTPTPPSSTPGSFVGPR